MARRVPIDESAQGSPAYRLTSHRRTITETDIVNFVNLVGLVYGYLALARPSVLLGARYLLVIGLAMLLGYVFLGWRYWFEAPFRGIVLATVLYVAAIVASWA